MQPLPKQTPPGKALRRPRPLSQLRGPILGVIIAIRGEPWDGSDRESQGGFTLMQRTRSGTRLQATTTGKSRELRHQVQCCGSLFEIPLMDASCVLTLSACFSGAGSRCSTAGLVLIEMVRSWSPHVQSHHNDSGVDGFLKSLVVTCRHVLCCGSRSGGRRRPRTCLR